jgi:hypothetical protein
LKNEAIKTEIIKTEAQKKIVELVS